MITFFSTFCGVSQHGAKKWTVFGWRLFLDLKIWCLIKTGYEFPLTCCQAAQIVKWADLQSEDLIQIVFYYLLEVWPHTSQSFSDFLLTCFEIILYRKHFTLLIWLFWIVHKSYWDIIFYIILLFWQRFGWDLAIAVGRMILWSHLYCFLRVF